MFPSMTDQQLVAFKESLTFLYVDELKEVAAQLGLVDKGNKMAIIMRILHFLQTGHKLTVPKFPESSRAKRGEVYSLDRDTLLLKGAYKNDLKTRLFFKQLIGDHFHFTAFGIDWINERWMEGNPPTYQEFAEMWQEEYRKRKEMPAAPKEEWAYINFVKHYLDHSPSSTRESIHNAWERERQRHKNRVHAKLESLKEEM